MVGMHPHATYLHLWGTAADFSKGIFHFNCKCGELQYCYEASIQLFIIISSFTIELVMVFRYKKILLLSTDLTDSYR